VRPVAAVRELAARNHFVGTLLCGRGQRLGPFEGRHIEARADGIVRRQHGLFDSCDVDRGSPEQQQQVHSSDYTESRHLVRV
jgi:hypothetical protein